MVNGAKLNSLQLAIVASKCLKALEKHGISLEFRTDFEQVANIGLGLGKPYLTPKMSPLFHDLARGSCFWLVMVKDGLPVGSIGVRFEDIGDEEFDRYLMRTGNRHYPVPDRETIEKVAKPLRDVSGKLAYFGELVVSDRSGRRTDVLGWFLLFAHVQTLINWPDVDWIYAFVSKAHGVRGQAARYWFTRQIPFAQTWSCPPEERGSEEWFFGTQGQIYSTS